MSSNQPDCLTSLVSYVPDLNFGLNLPSTGVANQFGISTTNQKQQSVSLLPEQLIPLESISARIDCNYNCIPLRRTSPQPLRSALKKTLLTKPCNGGEEKFKVRDSEEKQIFNPKHSTETETKAEKPQPLPARLLQKKKTVAFGRTVNVSQTIEGTSRAHRKFSVVSNSQKKKFSKMATTDQNARSLDEFGKLKEEVYKMQLKIDELTKLKEEVHDMQLKDLERSDQLLQLTKTMKKILGGLAQFNILSNDNNEDSKMHEKKVEAEMRYRDKENILPNKKYVSKYPTEGDEKSPTVHGELFADATEKIGSSKEDLKWAIMKRKYAENEEFKRLVDEAIMKCGGDESLDIFASDQNKGDTSRFRVRSLWKKKPQPNSPVIRSTTRVTKQMTVEQIGRCGNSPVSCAFSYDSEKYLARHGIIPELSDDDEVEHKMACGKQLDPSVQSYYYPGNSVTYYSKNTKGSNIPLKDGSCLDLSRNHTSHSNYREERRYYREEKLPRAVSNKINYQVDQFDTDDDEDVNSMIVINDVLEVQDHCETGVKIRSPQDTKGWKVSDLESNSDHGFQHDLEAPSKKMDDFADQSSETDYNIDLNSD